MGQAGGEVGVIFLNFLIFLVASLALVLGVLLDMGRPSLA